MTETEPVAATVATKAPFAPVRLFVWVLAVALGLIGEIALTVAATREWIELPAMLGAHLALVATLALLLGRRLRSGNDGGLSTLTVVAILATGPFGAVCALLMPLLTRRNAENEALLPGWYKRVALSSEQGEFTRLSDRVAIGRAANLAAPLPEPLVALFTSGPVPEQQAALGLIARAFHPGYLPVLKMALDSPEPVIRVQAAAVAARIRGPLNEHVIALFGRAADPLLTAADAVDVTAELKAAIDSGLLEAGEEKSAKGIRDGLLARTFARIDARRRAPSREQLPTTEAMSDDVGEAYAAHLLATGRYQDFRSFRRAIRRPLQGRYRSRVVAVRAIAPRLKDRLVPVSARR